VVERCRYTPRPDRKVPSEPQVGVANGLAVYGPSMGLLLEVEALATPAARAPGRLDVTGLVAEEEMGRPGHIVRRRSMALGAVDNVLTVLRRHARVDPRRFDLHINFPGGMPVDGPSAGVSIATAVYSAITGQPVNNRVAMTGEVSIHGTVRAVGGVVAKVEAAHTGGADTVIVPEENWQESFGALPVRVVPVRRLQEVLDLALMPVAAPTVRVARPERAATAAPPEPAAAAAGPMGNGGGVTHGA
jgi:ATP-dependent Lon protease